MLTVCSARNKAGAPCSAQAWKDDLCRWHHPELEAQRAEARSKGGAARSTAARARKKVPTAMAPAELGGWLSLLFTQVMDGDVEPRIATACAAIAKTLTDLRQSSELETRLTELEAAAGVKASRWRA